MRILSKPILLAVCVAVAGTLTALHRDPDGNADARPRPPASSTAARKAEGYDLTALQLFNQVLMRIKDNYVDPSRIRPRDMLVAALNQVEHTAAEVLVEEDGASGLKVRVGTFEKTFDIAGVEAPWDIYNKMKTILRFIQAHLRPDTDAREVEYAAINGMLSTLDPHSLLLKPETYNEMKLSTRGEFGGLGIVISMVKGVLTVMNPMKDTPASRAGLKSCDQILKIEEESTVNMTLTQAVNRLRGTPGSQVEVTLSRAGWSAPVRKTLTRDIIKVPSVDSRMLDKKVGYIRLRSFQGNSTDDLREALSRLREQGMRSLVLDLRGNPGGLLDQAVKIADVFIDSGTLLTTVSFAGKRREEKRAHSRGTEARYPMAVLVSSGSASASEIVAGALKNLDRAVILGNRTFGKGSVQVLYDNEDGSALKLTIAQYLTPGDISIQSVGITPDVQTSPMIINRDFIRLVKTDYSRRENDLDQHLTHSNTRPDQKPSRTVHYLAEQLEPEDDEEADPEEGKAEPSGEVTSGEDLCLYPDRECKPVDEDKFVMDFQIKLARDLVASARTWRRSQILEGADPLLQQHQGEQEKQVVSELKKLGVDWNPAPPLGPGAPRISVKVATEPVEGKAQACRPLKLKVTVTNDGTQPASQLQAVTDSTNPIFKGHEFVFGRVDPGKSRSWVVPIKVRDAPTRVDEVSFKFKELRGGAPSDLSLPISVQGVERPVFAYGYQLIDDLEGNQDGRAQRGEKVRLFVRVRNTGKGPSLRTITTLKNLSGEGIFIRKGRFSLDRLEPGQSKSASFTLDVQRAFAEDEFKVELTVYDDGLREYTSEKLTFPVAKYAEGPTAASGVVRVSADGAQFRAWAADDAPVVGTAARGAAFQVQAHNQSHYRVVASKGRTAFIASKDVTPGGAAGEGQFKPRWQVTPPTVALQVPSYITGDKTITIKGQVSDETQVVDAYIFVRNPDAKIEGRKIFYQANDLKKSPRKMSFSARVPLWPGANYVSVYAREDDDVIASENIVVFRKDATPTAASK